MSEQYHINCKKDDRYGVYQNQGECKVFGDGNRIISKIMAEEFAKNDI